MAGTGQLNPNKDEVEDTSKVVNPKEAVRQITSLIIALEEFKKDDDELTTGEVDSVILGIGKLRGAVNKLNREK